MGKVISLQRSRIAVAENAPDWRSKDHKPVVKRSVTVATSHRALWQGIDPAGKKGRPMAILLPKKEG